MCQTTAQDRSPQGLARWTRNAHEVGTAPWLQAPQDAEYSTEVEREAAAGHGYAALLNRARQSPGHV